MPPSDDSQDMPLTESVAETRFDAIEKELRAEPRLKLLQIERKPGQLTVHRGELSVEFTFANLGDVTGGRTVVSAVLRRNGATLEQLAVITRWDKAEFLDRLKALNVSTSRSNAVRRTPANIVSLNLQEISTQIDHRLAGITGNTRRVTGKTLSVLMVERHERHVFTYVDRGGGKAAIEVRTTCLAAPMETRRLPDIYEWDVEEFLDVILGNRWKLGIMEEEGA